MAKIAAVSLLVAALVLHASATYHFKQKTLGVCDVKVRVVTTTPEPDEYMQFKVLAHGKLIRQTSETCKGGACEATLEQLFRPDLATGDNAAKEFAWQPAIDGQCASLQVDEYEIPDMYTPIEGDFENRELALFHGIKCFKYSDPDSPDAIFGDDATGAFYGLEIDGVRHAYNFTPAIHTPQTFTFNATQMPECEPDSFKEPIRDVYEKECEHLPTHKPASALLRSRYLRALSHKLRAHKHL